MNCPNCRAVISCGCQKRSASDGRQVCSSCLTTYEQNLQRNKKLLDQQRLAQQSKPKQ